jgi:hypothetical protein
MALQNQPPPRKRIPRGGQHYRHIQDAQRRGDDTRDVMAHRRRLLAAHQAKHATPPGAAAEDRQADPPPEADGAPGGMPQEVTREASIEGRCDERQ